jgi:hypothetical protein
MMIDAEVLQGSELQAIAGSMLEDNGADYLHVHNAKPGCFAVRVERGQTLQPLLYRSKEAISGNSNESIHHR